MATVQSDFEFPMDKSNRKSFSFNYDNIYSNIVVHLLYVLVLNLIEDIY